MIEIKITKENDNLVPDILIHGENNLSLQEIASLVFFLSNGSFSLVLLEKLSTILDKNDFNKMNKLIEQINIITEKNYQDQEDQDVLEMAKKSIIGEK